MTERLPHDSGYKNFFSNPEMVESLLRDFVPEEFVAELDFSTLERCSGSYVAEDLRERHDDVVWRVGWKDGSWCYVLLLMEFQSTPDHWMALRVLSYTALLLLDLVKSGQVSRGEGLPPVFPLVIYNGSKVWRAPCDVAELFAPMPRSLQAYRPQARHFLLDESRVPEAALTGSPGPAALLLRLERARDPEEVRGIVRELIDRLRGPQYLSLRRAFTVWLGRVALARSGMTSEIPEFQDLQEVDAMLEERAAQWKDEYIRQGVIIGQELGEARGFELGESRGLELGEARATRAVLLALLEAKFGSVSPELDALLERAARKRGDHVRLTLAVHQADSPEALADMLTDF